MKILSISEQLTRVQEKAAVLAMFPRIDCQKIIDAANQLGVLPGILLDAMLDKKNQYVHAEQVRLKHQKKYLAKKPFPANTPKNRR